MKELFQYIKGKPFYEKLYVLAEVTFIPVGFIHELYHLLFIGLFGLPWQLDKIVFLKKHNENFTILHISINFQTLNGWKILIVSAAPILGLFLNLLIYVAFFGMFHLTLIGFMAIFAYHVGSIYSVLPSEADVICMQKALRILKNKE